MSAPRCPHSMSGDQTWPAELDQDARCRDCGLWYAEYVDRLGDVFVEPERTPPWEDATAEGGF